MQEEGVPAALACSCVPKPPPPLQSPYTTVRLHGTALVCTNGLPTRDTVAFLQKTQPCSSRHGPDSIHCHPLNCFFLPPLPHGNRKQWGHFVTSCVMTIFTLPGSQSWESKQRLSKAARSRYKHLPRTAGKTDMHVCMHPCTHAGMNLTIHVGTKTER